MPSTTSSAALSLGRGGQADHRLRAELHPDHQGRLSRAAPRGICAQGRDRRAACLTFEECLERTPDRDAAFRARPQRILVQGHCHQRSLVGMAPMLRLLRRIPGAEVVDPRRRLLRHGRLVRLREGALRSVPPGRRAAALPRASRGERARRRSWRPAFRAGCRSQHFTGRKAVHPGGAAGAVLDRGLPDERTTEHLRQATLGGGRAVDLLLGKE